MCDTPGSYLHLYGRLFHQYIVDQFSKIELGRLSYYKFNQDHIRADLYQNIKTTDDQLHGINIGKRVILPSTYKGSPSNLNQLFQNEMAVIR